MQEIDFYTNKKIPGLELIPGTIKKIPNKMLKEKDVFPRCKRCTGRGYLLSDANERHFSPAIPITTFQSSSDTGCTESLLIRTSAISFRRGSSFI